MPNDLIEDAEQRVEEALAKYIDMLLRNVKSPFKKQWAKHLLITDFNNTLPRGIYMDSEIFETDENGEENTAK